MRVTITSARRPAGGVGLGVGLEGGGVVCGDGVRGGEGEEFVGWVEVGRGDDVVVGVGSFVGVGGVEFEPEVAVGVSALAVGEGFVGVGGVHAVGGNRCGVGVNWGWLGFGWGVGFWCGERAATVQVGVGVCGVV